MQFAKSKTPASIEFKRLIYKIVLNYYVGDLFSFDFHLDMLRELFGDGEARELVRGAVKKTQETEGGLLKEQPASGVAADVAKTKLANIWSRGAQNIDWRALDLLENPVGFVTYIRN